MQLGAETGKTGALAACCLGVNQSSLGNWRIKVRASARVPTTTTTHRQSFCIFMWQQRVALTGAAFMHRRPQMTTTTTTRTDMALIIEVRVISHVPVCYPAGCILCPDPRSHILVLVANSDACRFCIVCILDSIALKCLLWHASRHLWQEASHPTPFATALSILNFQLKHSFI